MRRALQSLYRRSLIGAGDDEKAEVAIYDTTLRDGAQAEGVSFSAVGKLLLARRLDQFGVDYIEGGFPGSNPKDMAFFEAIRDEEFEHAKIAAFGSTRRVKTSVKDDPIVQGLLAAQYPRGDDLRQKLEIACPGCAAHDARGEPGDGGRYGGVPEGQRARKSSSMPSISSMATSTIRTMPCRCWRSGKRPGRMCSCCAIRTADACRTRSSPSPDGGAGSGGGRHPYAQRRRHGVANALEAVRAGAVQVQGTMNGYGERCGNANLTTIMPACSSRWASIASICAS
jgi:2-isopropylmalate synthase